MARVAGVNEMKQPHLYTTREGGQWFRWDHGEIAEDALVTIPIQPVRTGFITINNAQVHSLIWLKDEIIKKQLQFHNKIYCGSNDKKARWDCFNGWTQGAQLVE